MPATQNNGPKKQQAPRGKKRGNEEPAPAQPPAKKNKRPEKGSRLEAETKLENLKNDLEVVLTKIAEAEEQKEKILDRMTYWKDELASRPDDTDKVRAIRTMVETLFEQCGTKDGERAKKAVDIVEEDK